MQERFTSSIARMNEAIIAEDTDVEKLLNDLESVIRDKEVTAELFFMQEQKAALMAELQRGLQQLDEAGTVGVEGKMRKVVGDEATGELSIFGSGGITETVSRGQLMVSGLWDEEYFLDDSVPYELKKKYLLKKTRYQIADLYDHQIALFEGSQGYNKNTGRDDSYNAIAGRYAEGAEVQPGVMAEKMVESFLTKLTYDYNVPYRLKNVSVFEDVEYKIDFLIEPHFDGEVVGVGVEEPQDRPDIAIQFTTARKEATIEHKEKQVKAALGNIGLEDSLHVKNLILVVLPIDHVVETFEEWQNTKIKKRNPGGPDELWDEAVKEKIFKKLMAEIFSAEQIDKTWSQVESKNN